VADPTKNALRAAIVEQDIGPEGASWPPQISLRNGSNHGGDRGLEWWWSVAKMPQTVRNLQNL